ncbi:hypothetical protein MKW98_026921 [Papaver atlanticum]|uniref:Uncharacterized protein n=1 Tax=Papaver atlanticum TaxID=357466 RepID=A0AAD4SVT7_9MAGN|nr:hypothetical protein MKW98_026921 [Papaver atlanticum]
MELQLINAREEAGLWRKTCRELEGYFFDLRRMEYQEIELDKQLLSTIGMFNDLYFQFDKKKFECFQMKKKFNDLVSKDGKFVYDTSLRKRVQHLEEQADFWLNHELKMKYFVEEYKGKYETLLLKFKEKKIEFELMKDECKGLKEKIKSLEKRNKKSGGTGGKEMMVRFGYLEDEYRKMEIEERGKCVQLSMEIEGLKSAKKRADEEVEELKFQATSMVSMVNANVELGKELEDYKAKYHDLVVQLNERIGSEGKLRETITRLEEENKKMEMDQTVKCVELGKEIEAAKKREDDEFSVLERKCMESEVQVTVSSNYAIELGRELKNQMSIVGRRDNELEDYKTRCTGMEKEILGLINERNAMSEREKTAQDKVAYLEKVVKEMENDKRETEKRALECWKGEEEEDEMESWKKKLMELVRRSSKMEEENLSLRGSQNEGSCMKIDDKIGVANKVHPELTDNMFVEPNNKPSPLRGNSEDVHIPDPHYNNNQERSENDLDKKKNTCSDSMVESAIAVEQQIASETEGNLGDSLVLLEQGAVNTLPIDVIEIDSENEYVEVLDSEDEKEITATHPCTVEGKALPLVSTDETFTASEKCVKRPLSLQRDEEGEASSDKAILTPWSQIYSTSKRFRTSEISISQRVRQKDD